MMRVRERERNEGQGERLGRGNGKEEGGYSFTTSSWDFFGRISSMCGVRSGYVSRILARMARCTDDLTLDLAEGVMLVEGCVSGAFELRLGVRGTKWRHGSGMRRGMVHTLF